MRIEVWFDMEIELVNFKWQGQSDYFLRNGWPPTVEKALNSNKIKIYYV